MKLNIYNVIIQNKKHEQIMKYTINFQNKNKK